MKMLKLFALAVTGIAVLACTTFQDALPPPSPPPPELSMTAEASIVTLADVKVTVDQNGKPSINPIVVDQGEQDIEWTGINGVTDLKLEFKDKNKSKWHGKMDKQLTNPSCSGGNSPCKLTKSYHKDFDKGCWGHGLFKKKSEFCVFEYTITGLDSTGAPINVDPVVIIKPYP